MSECLKSLEYDVFFFFFAAEEKGDVMSGELLELYTSGSKYRYEIFWHLIIG